MKRYYITAPVAGGYAWWDVRDRIGLFDNPYYARFPVASFFRDEPNAEQMRTASDTHRSKNPESAQAVKTTTGCFTKET